MEKECGGAAKHANGFVSIDDVIRMKQRVSTATWLAEMLCERPGLESAVFTEFDETLHVRPELPPPDLHLRADPRREGLYCGVDFGIRNPFVCLWIRRDAWGRSFVFDEYILSGFTILDHIRNLAAKGHPKPRKICCDPAGSALCEQTGQSNMDQLRAAQYTVTAKRSLVPEGIEKVKAALRSASGHTSLYIHPRCKNLIKALRTYHYGKGRSENPAKDGPDHLADALRYYYISRDTGELEVRTY